MSRSTNKEFYVPKGPRKKSELELFIEKHRLPPFEDMVGTLIRAIFVSLAVIVMCLIFGFRLAKSTDGEGVKYRYCGFMWFGEPTLGRLNSSDGNGATVFFGKLYYRDGSVYKGDYKDDVPNGKGVYTYSGGSSYEGEFKNGKREGYGIYRFPDGQRYEGEFKGGKYHGRGVLYFASGAIKKGIWENDVYIGTGEDSDS